MPTINNTSRKNILKKKLEEGRIRRNKEMATTAGIEDMDLYKKPLVRYVITVFSDGTFKADKLEPEQQNKKEEEDREESK